MTMPVLALQKQLRKTSNKAKALVLCRFFKTGPGEYGEGDRFLGLTVPQVRRLAKPFCGLPLKEITSLMRSPFHEERLAGGMILVERFKDGDSAEKKKYFNFYIRNSPAVNNWDLVDLSAPGIAGAWLVDKSEKERAVLYRFARSKNLWQRRIAIVATLTFIRKNKFRDTFEISKLLLEDRHDLMHKAVGWMLREVGKRHPSALEGFLKRYYARIPRTTLRYSIERFPEAKRQVYLRGEFLK